MMFKLLLVLSVILVIQAYKTENQSFLEENPCKNMECKQWTKECVSKQGCMPRVKECLRNLGHDATHNKDMAKNQKNLDQCMGIRTDTGRVYNCALNGCSGYYKFVDVGVAVQDIQNDE